jgi:vacuolar-type H+-ATPase subunit H
MSDQTTNEAEEASSLLQMARQLHEQHVSSARAEAERVLGQAHSEANRLVSEARGEANRLVTNATDESNRLVRDAQIELHGLQRSIDESRRFESGYRESLRKYLSDLLTEVDARGDVVQAPEVAAPPMLVLPETSPASAVVEPEYRSEGEVVALTDTKGGSGYTPIFATTAAALPEEPAFEATADEVPAFDQDSTFEDDALGADAFDKLAEPDASAEDIVIEPEEEIEEVVAVPAEDEANGAFPAFDEPVIETESTDDTVEGLLATEEEVHQETDAVPTVSVVPTIGEPVNDENIDTLIESLADIKGTEIDDDGGSSVEAEEVDAPAEEPTYDADQILDPIQQAADEVPDEAYQGHVELESETGKTEDELEDAEAANDGIPAFETNESIESFDEITSNAGDPTSDEAEDSDDEDDEDKKRFSFFGKK